MGVRPSTGQSWPRYAVLGDPRPTSDQVWPRLSDVYVPPAGDMFFSFNTGEVWPLGTAGPVGFSFGPEDPSIYQWATHLAPDENNDWLEFNIPDAGGPTCEVVGGIAVLRDIDGNHIGANNIQLTDIFVVEPDPLWPFATPGSTPFYFYFDGAGLVPPATDIWDAFRIPGETTPPIAGDPVYIDVPFLLNGQPYTVRYFDNGYITYGPFSLQMEFDSMSDVETGRDWLHIVMTIDFVPDAVFYQISEDNGATWKTMLRLIVPDPGDPSFPSDPIHPVMYDYTPADGLLDVLMGLYNISGDYVSGISDISGMFFRVVVNPPGYGSTVDNGASFGEFGPVPPPTHFSTPTNPIGQYTIPRPQ